MTKPNAQNWREIGDTTLTVFGREFRRVNSPMLSDAQAIYEAARPHSALFLAHSRIENQHATTGIVVKPEHHNPLTLSARYGEPRIPYPQEPSMHNRFAMYARWEDCIAAWKKRFTDPNLGYKDTVTLEQYLAIYAPDDDVHPVTGVSNADMRYPEKVRAHLAEFAAIEGGQFVPNILDKWFPLPYWVPFRNGDTPKVIVIHIQDGTNQGSYDWWLNGYINGVKVKASSTVMIARNGDIWRVVPEEHGPWTNGDVKSPSVKGTQIINQFGWNPNVYSLTIETEGFSKANAFGWAVWPLPQAQLDSIVWQVKQWMARYNIPKERVIKHADINSVDRRYCPGDQLYNYVMNAITSTVPVPSYAEPSPVPGFDGTQDVEYNGVTFYADKKTVKSAVDGVNVRQFANTQSALTRAPLKKDDSFPVLGWCHGEAVNDEDRWWVTQTYSRVWVGGTVEKPSMRAPSNPEIVGTARFYRAGLDGTGRDVTANGATHLRQWAEMGSPVVRALAKGEKVRATHFVIGEEMLGEPLWWVIDGIRGGSRLWVGATTEKPC